MLFRSSLAGTLDEAKWLYNSIRGPVARVLPNATALFGYLADDKRTALALEFLDYKQPQFMAFHFNDLGMCCVVLCCVVLCCTESDCGMT